MVNAGLPRSVTLAQRLGLGELVDNHVDLGDAPGRANTGDKFLTLVASALAGGDCIDDADALPKRQGGKFAAFTGQRTERGALAPTGQQQRRPDPAAAICGKCGVKGRPTSQRVLVPNMQRLRLILGQDCITAIERTNERIITTES